jgi:hypothetical protein
MDEINILIKIDNILLPQKSQPCFKKNQNIISVIMIHTIKKGHIAICPDAYSFIGSM